MIHAIEPVRLARADKPNDPETAARSTVMNFSSAGAGSGCTANASSTITGGWTMKAP
jgi:hypothetical protein